MLGRGRLPWKPIHQKLALGAREGACGNRKGVDFEVKGEILKLQSVLGVASKSYGQNGGN